MYTMSKDILNEVLARINNFSINIKGGGLRSFYKLVLEGDSVAVSLILWTCVGAISLVYLISRDNKDKSSQKEDKELTSSDQITPVVLRDFTLQQLKDFDGTNDKPVYIAIKGDVYDVSKSIDLYGKEGAYGCFAGRDATRALAKLSFEECDLSNPKFDDLNPMERDVLDGWIEKFKYYRCYPIVGRVDTSIRPPKDFKRSDIQTFNGTQPVPPGRVDAPIYVGLNGKVFDVSYGGKEHYGPDGGYNIFAGKDVTRALAKMSFKEEDINYTGSPSDLTDLNDTHIKTLQDWEKKFMEVKKYPVVGTLIE